MSDRVICTDIFHIGETTPFMRRFGYVRIGSWSKLVSDLVPAFDCDEDAITTRDLYWGGEHGDENCVDGIMVDGALVATFDRSISHREAAEIAAIADNDVIYNVSLA
jgi:hypothetical protein